MKTYNVNNGKRKQVLKQYSKASLATAGGGIKFCHALTIIIRILAVVLGVINVAYAVCISGDMVDLLFLSLTFVIPYALSFIPAVAYRVGTACAYRFRRNESITVKENGFIYSYHDDRAHLASERYSFDVDYSQIKHAEYNPKTGLLKLEGIISGEVYHGAEVFARDTWAELSLLNIYDFDIADNAVKNCH